MMPQLFVSMFPDRLDRDVSGGCDLFEGFAGNGHIQNPFLAESKPSQAGNELSRRSLPFLFRPVAVSVRAVRPEPPAPVSLLPDANDPPCASCACGEVLGSDPVSLRRPSGNILLLDFPIGRLGKPARLAGKHLRCLLVAFFACWRLAKSSGWVLDREQSEI
jgi:hypothetical protein